MSEMAERGRLQARLERINRWLERHRPSGCSPADQARDAIEEAKAKRDRASIEARLAQLNANESRARASASGTESDRLSARIAMFQFGVEHENFEKVRLDVMIAELRYEKSRTRSNSTEEHRVDARIKALEAEKSRHESERLKLQANISALRSQLSRLNTRR